jgi:hypothetical protein
LEKVLKLYNARIPNGKFSTQWDPLNFFPKGYHPLWDLEIFKVRLDLKPWLVFTLFCDLPNTGGYLQTSNGYKNWYDDLMNKRPTLVSRYVIGWTKLIIFMIMLTQSCKYLTPCNLTKSPWIGCDITHYTLTLYLFQMS